MPYVSTELPSRSSFTLFGKLLCIATLVFTLFGAKVFFVRNFGSVVPYWDQWDGEADLLYKSYMNSTLSFAKLLSSHNEHRILTARVFSLALFELDGGWDPILQMIANALLHVGAVVLLVLIVQRILRPRQLLLLILFSMVVFALPIGWENLLVGFQSQFYFLLIFSLLALMGFAVSPALSFGWWLSFLSTIAAYFSMASGALTTATAFTVVAVQLLFGIRKGLREIVAAGLLLATSVIMVLFITDVVGHHVYQAHSLLELIKAFLRCMAFPLSHPMAALLINLPLMLYGCFVLIARPARQSPHWIILGVVIWIAGQALSLSFGRAVLVGSPRYLDIIILTLPLNFGVLMFAQNRVLGAEKQVGALVSVLVWLALVIPALVSHALQSSIPGVIVKSAQGVEQRTNVVEYLKSRNIAVLQGKQSQAIPYPDPERLASLLSDPVVRLILPSPIRPIDIDEKELLNRTILKGKLRSVINRIELAVLKYAQLIFGIGIALAFVAGLLQERLSSIATRNESVAIDARPDAYRIFRGRIGQIEKLTGR